MSPSCRSRIGDRLGGDRVRPQLHSVSRSAGGDRVPDLFAFAQFEFWQLAIVFLCLNLVQFLIGSYFEPRFAGATLSVSPFLILLAVFFWTYLWGIAGAFIGVPIVIAF